MQRLDYNAIGTVMKYLHESQPVRRIVWACIGAVYVYVFAVLITAIRWWQS